ncbi:MAG: glycosyltransferase [Chitinophagaceae bacterium]|nr:MAG: glycosyltransferase [Chitinophagaceae bacterium]
MVKIVVSHPTGNQNVRAAINGLMKQGALAQFQTTIATFPGRKLDLISKVGSLAEFKRRSYHPSLKGVTKTSPARELIRHAVSKMGWKRFVKHETGPFSIDKISRALDKKVATSLNTLSLQGLNAVYGYEDVAALTFRRAKEKGIHCFYDLPTGYWRAARKLLEIEKEKWPEWMGTMVGFRDSLEKLQRKDEELSLSDRVFVASQFTASTLQEYPGTLPPIQIIPYGFPMVSDSHRYEAVGNYEKRPLRLLFVGKLTQQKGLADLFAALQGLDREVELTLVGHKTGECKPLEEGLKKYRWTTSLPHDQVLKLMREHDVLVFPSLFDGFGLVITEAMAQGTPVIASDRSAGPDLIKHGENGWLMKGGEAQSLRSVIEEILNNRDSIAKVGVAAINSAKQRPWDVYSTELYEAISDHMLQQ